MPDHLSQEDAGFRDRLQAFIARELAERSDESAAARRARIIAAAKDAGFYQMTQPEAFGGRPGTQLQLTLAREALAASRTADSALVFGPAPGVLAGVDDPLRSSHLAPLLAGTKRTAFAFTEPDDAERHSWAVRDGDNYVVNGAKSYVTGGAEADFINALIHIENEGPAMIVIDTDAPGVERVATFASLDGSRHQAFAFHDVRVPPHHIIGKPGEGLPRALRQIGDTRLAIAASCTGAALWVLEFLTGHLQRPHRGGQPLAALESVRLRYAQLRIDTFAARSMLYRTARLADAGDNIVNEAIACKVFASEAIARTVDQAIQLVGGQALREAHPLAALYREVRAYPLTEGANDVLRLNLVRGQLELGKGRV